MVLLPLLALSEFAVSTSMGLAVLQAVGIMVLVVLAGPLCDWSRRFILLRVWANSDTFVAMALLLVLGFAWVMNQIGLSMALGAFMAGVLLA